MTSRTSSSSRGASRPTSAAAWRPRSPTASSRRRTCRATGSRPSSPGDAASRDPASPPRTGPRACGRPGCACPRPAVLGRAHRLPVRRRHRRRHRDRRGDRVGSSPRLADGAAARAGRLPVVRGQPVHHGGRPNRSSRSSASRCAATTTSSSRSSSSRCRATASEAASTGSPSASCSPRWPCTGVASRRHPARHRHRQRAGRAGQSTAARSATSTGSSPSTSRCRPVGMALWIVVAAAFVASCAGRRGARRVTGPALIGGALWAALAGCTR